MLRIALSKGTSHLLPGLYASVKKSLTFWELVEPGYCVEDLNSGDVVKAFPPMRLVLYCHGRMWILGSCAQES